MNKNFFLAGYSWSPRNVWIMCLIFNFMIFANAFNYSEPYRSIFACLGLAFFIHTLLNPIYYGARVRKLREQLDANNRTIEHNQKIIEENKRFIEEVKQSIFQHRTKTIEDFPKKGLPKMRIIEVIQALNKLDPDKEVFFIHLMPKHVVEQFENLPVLNIQSTIPMDDIEILKNDSDSTLDENIAIGIYKRSVVTH